jgi:hypothetical protein
MDGTYYQAPIFIIEAPNLNLIEGPAVAQVAAALDRRLMAISLEVAENQPPAYKIPIAHATENKTAVMVEQQWLMVGDRLPINRLDRFSISR